MRVVFFVVLVACHTSTASLSPPSHIGSHSYRRINLEKEAVSVQPVKPDWLNLDASGADGECKSKDICWKDTSGKEHHAKKPNQSARTSDGTAFSNPVWSEESSPDGKIGAWTFDNSDKIGKEYFPLDWKMPKTTVIETLTVCAKFKTSYNKPPEHSNWNFIGFDRSELWTFFLEYDGLLGMSTGSKQGVHDLKEGQGVGFNTLGYGKAALNSNVEPLNDGKWHVGCAVVNKKTKSLYRGGSMDSSNKPTRFEETAKKSMMGEVGGSQLDRWGMIGDGSEAESFDGSRNLVGFTGSIAYIKVWSTALTKEELDKTLLGLDPDPTASENPKADSQAGKTPENKNEQGACDQRYRTCPRGQSFCPNRICCQTGTNKNPEVLPSPCKGQIWEPYDADSAIYYGGCPPGSEICQGSRFFCCVYKSKNGTAGFSRQGETPKGKDGDGDIPGCGADDMDWEMTQSACNTMDKPAFQSAYGNRETDPAPWEKVCVKDNDPAWMKEDGTADYSQCCSGCGGSVAAGPTDYKVVCGKWGLKNDGSACGDGDEEEASDSTPLNDNVESLELGLKALKSELSISDAL